MALKIVTGGTAGARDGTLVSSGNKIVFDGLSPSYESVMVRCDDGYWSNDQEFTIPSLVQISLDGGGSWKGVADSPYTYTSDIGDVNQELRLRQTAGTGSPNADLVTDGTYTAVTALSTPTPGNTLIDLSWTNVSNEDGYTLDRSTAADFSANLVSVSKGAGVTTHQATGLTNGVTYYFRVRAEGSGRYSDSGWGTDDATPAGAPTTVDFPLVAGGDGAVRAFGSGGGWFATARGAATGNDAYAGNTGHYGCLADPVNLLLMRGFFPGDTSALPDGATIVSASLFVYSYVAPLTGGGGTDANKSACLVASTQASPTALTTADYDQVGSTLFAPRIRFADMPNGGWVEFVLNTAGKAAINKTGHSLFALLSGYDLDDVAPVTDAAGFGAKFTDETGTTYDPYLRVTYTV